MASRLFDIQCTPDIFGVEIFLRRKELRCSQVVLSSLSGVSDSHLSNIERGADVTVTRFVKVAAALGMPPGALVQRCLRVVCDPDEARSNIDGLCVSEPSWLASEYLKGCATEAVCSIVHDIVILALGCEFTDEQPAQCDAGGRSEMLVQKFRVWMGSQTPLEVSWFVVRLRMQGVLWLLGSGVFTREEIEAAAASWIEDSGISQMPLDETSRMRDEGNVSKTPTEKLIDRVKSHLCVRGSQADLSRALDIPPQTLSNYLLGVNVPNGDVALRMLEWVTAREAKNKDAAGARTPTAHKTRSEKHTINEKIKPSRNRP